LSLGGSRDRLVGIQVGRGVAASLVVVYHGARMLVPPQYLGHTPTDIFAFGHAGVDFFFVISGFIITYVHGHELGQRDRLTNYLWRRATRIYPVYWLVTAVVIVLSLFSAHRGERLDPTHIFASLLLVPHGREPLLGVAWTLEHEMLFYCAFALVLVRRELVVPLLVTAFVLILGAWLFPGNVALDFLGDAYHLQFLMGIGAALVVRAVSARGARPLLIGGVIGFIFVGMLENHGAFQTSGLVSKLAFGIASTAIVIGAAAERQKAIRFGSVGIFFGAASYSIYLLHTIVIGLIARILAGSGAMSALPDAAILLIVSVAAIAAGLGLYAVVERPLMVGLRQLPFGPGSRRNRNTLPSPNMR
jgi:peptidoglycan/LPS O-acetylase OafA/YrhL